MSCDIDSDSFHVKKGGVRKTVTSRRAYVNTHLAIAKKVMKIADSIDAEKYSLAYSEAVQLAEKLSASRQFLGTGGKKRWDIR